MKHLLVSMKLLYTKFVTPPEYGDNRFIFQPVFRNKNFTRIVKGKKRTLLQQDFGVDRKATLSVDKWYNGIIFKHTQWAFEIIISNEGAYLLLKRIITTNFSKNGRYPQPLVNKAVQDLNLENIFKLFASKQKGSKKFWAVNKKILEMLHPGKRPWMMLPFLT